MGSIVVTKRRDKATGKEIAVYRAHVRRTGFASKSKVFTSKRDAQDWLRNNDADSTLERVSAGKTLESLIEDFVKAPPARGTRYWTAMHLDFWTEQLGAMKVADISRGDINGAIVALRQRPAHRSTSTGPLPTGAKLSPATVNRYLASLSSVFNFALDHEVIEAHPMKGGNVRRLAESAGRTRILTDDEEQRLMAAAKVSSWPMLHLFVRTCLTTAARRSEVLRLRWQDVRLADSVAVLGKTKNGRPRAMPLVSDVRAGLAEAQKVRPLHSDYVFFNPKRPAEPMNINAAWKACREAAGLLNDRADPLDRVYLHSTRHTAVTRMLKGGANLAQAAAVSGHQTLAMLKRYEHLAAADVVDVAERLLAGKEPKP